MSHRFYMVDVFAERPYAGNQLAVVVGADDMSGETMQQVAAEMNYSETTFVTSAHEADEEYRVRIFTPAREIAFAGHPILGTAWVVRHHVAPEAAGPVRLRLDVGQVPVTFETSPSLSAQGTSNSRVGARSARKVTANSRRMRRYARTPSLRTHCAPGKPSPSIPSRGKWNTNAKRVQSGKQEPIDLCSSSCTVIGSWSGAISTSNRPSQFDPSVVRRNAECQHRLSREAANAAWSGTGSRAIRSWLPCAIVRCAAALTPRQSWPGRCTRSRKWSS